jgi:hypothetical protein
MPKVERFIKVYLAGIQHGSDLSRRAQEHEDTTLTWELALMGGALLALPSTRRRSISTSSGLEEDTCWRARRGCSDAQKCGRRVRLS